MLKIIGFGLGSLLLVGIGFFVWLRYRLHHPKDNGNLEASLDKRMHRMLDSPFPEQTFVLGVFKDGRSLVKAYVHKPQTTENGFFELASTSKLFTTSLLQILADKGVVGLDDRIATLLQGIVDVLPAAAHTTLRHLATHTSGFPGLPQSFTDRMQDEQNPYKDLRTQDLYDYLQTCEGKKPEGSFEYSNFGMGLLGHLLALRTGVDYEALVKRELLKPLGMDHTFVIPDSEQQRQIVQGYDASGKRNPVWTDPVLTGAGSFLTNAADMLLFIRANLEAQNPLYPSLAKTHKAQPGVNGGLGWMFTDALDRFMGNEHVLWHNGMAGGYASYLAIDPVAKSGVILLSNQSKDVTTDGSLLMRIVTAQSWKRQD